MNSAGHNKSTVIIRRELRAEKNEFLRDLEALGIRDKFLSSKKIIIKPNLCAGDKYSSGSGVTTDYETISNLLELIEATNPGVRVYIVESSSYGGTDARIKFDFQKYDRLLVHRKNVELVDLSKEERVLKRIDGFYFKGNVSLPKVLFGDTFFVSLAKMKTHMLTMMSGALKNQFGCLPDMDKNKYHPFINEVIADINTIIVPDLSIVDGNPALEGWGPVLGRPRHMHMTIISNDPVGADVLVCETMGFDPKRVKHIRMASSMNIGRMDIKKINVMDFSGKQIDEKADFIPLKQRIIIRIGLFVQRIGQDLAELGHEIHIKRGFLEILRPTLEFLVKGITQSISFRLFMWLRDIKVKCADRKK
jgi:uncharacterized protein (DUF362 family)